MGIPKYMREISLLDDIAPFRGMTAIPNTCPSVADLLHHTMFLDAPPLLHDWKAIAYTDGSYKKFTDPQTGAKSLKVGSGVYIPDMDTGTQGLEIRIHPGRENSLTQTITRAELVAILHCITQLADPRNSGIDTIATDSLAMYLIPTRQLTDHKT